MSVLHKLGIVGLRSYSPSQIETISFHPLTLICGQNGSGKTTIIQALKFVTTGITPPGTLGGKNFVLDPKLIQKPQVVAEVKLNFSDYTGKKFVAGRKVIVSYTKRKGQEKMEFKTIQQSLKTRDQVTGQTVTINQHCAQIDRQIPSLFGVSKSVLQNVIFCQQDEALWPFGDNTTLKGIFDQLFQTKQYSKIYDNMKEIHKRLTKQIKQTSIALDGRRQIFYRILKQNKNNLVQFQQITKKSNELPVLINKLHELELDQGNSLSNEQQLRQNIKLSATLDARKHNIINKLQQMGSSEKQIQNLQQFTNTNDLIQQLKTIQTQLQPLIQDIQKLQKEYDELKSNELEKEVGALISLEIKSAIEKFTFLSDPSPSAIIPRLAQEQDQLEKLAIKLAEFRREIISIKVPELLNVQQGLIQSLRLREEIKNKELNQLQQLYSDVYLMIYNPDVKQTKKVEYSSSIHQQSQIELKNYQWSMKRILADRQNFSKQLQALEKKETISQMKYSGIVMPEQMLRFATEKKKCTFCYKPLTEGQIAHIQSRCEQRKIKVQNQVQEFQNSLGQYDIKGLKYNSIEQIDGQERKIKRQITRLSEILAKCQKLKFEEIEYKKYTQQIQVNRKIDGMLKRYDIVPKRNLSSQSKNKQFSFEDFAQYLNDFVYGLQQLRSIRSQIKKIEDINDQNDQRGEQRRKALERKKQIQNHISQMQPRVQTLPLVRASLSKLKQLNLRNRKPKAKSDVSAQSIEQQLYQKNKLRLQKLSRKEIIQRQIKLNTLSLEYTKTVEELNKSIQTIDRLQRKIQTNKSKNEKAQSLKMQIANLKTLIQTRVSCIKQQQNKAQEYQKILVNQRIKRQAEKQLLNTMKALQLSLTQFHAEKLEEINRILKDIWQTIYRKGDFNSQKQMERDISYIKIRSTDEEGHPSQNKKKPYCYALMMCVEGSQIQMKGRCSMGQKVLASIVIRLALAQCFAARCNILALDEPTANLDSTHILSLAQSLGKLIQSRKQEKGFQLIIITHDMQFVSMLTRYAPCYYEVKKINGWSKIVIQQQI